MKENRFFVLGILTILLVLGLVSACDNGSGTDTEEIDIRTFPENLLGEWISGEKSVMFRNREPDEGLPVKNGAFNCSQVSSHFIVMEDGISGNNYNLGSTVEGGRGYKNLSFTAKIGNDGKLTISDAKELDRVEGQTLLSNFEGGSSVNDINGIYTRKEE